MGITGFDWVMLDSEHSGNNPRAMEHLIRAAECVGLAPFVRVTQATDEADIHRALEAGAKGIFLPEIGSVDDVKKAGDAAFFPPKGNRGICPAVRAAHYNDKTFVDYFCSSFQFAYFWYIGNPSNEWPSNRIGGRSSQIMRKFLHLSHKEVESGNIEGYSSRLSEHLCGFGHKIINRYLWILVLWA